jgi:hypothetical protein
MASAPITESHTDTHTTSPMDIPTDHHIRQFDLKIVRDSFVNCIQPDNTLLLQDYVRAYEELCV